MVFSDLGSITTNTRSSNSCALADYDNDGDLDFYVANSSTSSGSPQNNDLYQNNQGNENNWISLTCIGTTSNRSAVGAKVRIKASIFGQSYWQLRVVSGSPTGDRAQNDQRVHFGLGDATIIDSVIIDWPSGIQDVFSSINVNQIITVTENDGVTGIEDKFNIPSNLTLNQNYPNPFNPSTTISYALPKLSSVTIKIYNMLGEEIAILVNNIKPAGEHSVIWDGKDHSGQQIPSGLYVYKINAGSTSSSKKMIFLK